MPEPAASTSATEAAFRYRVSGMDCGNCALTIEQSVRQLEGIEDVRVSFATGTLEGSGSVSRDALAARVEALGYRLADDAAPDAPALDRRGLAGFVRFLWRTPPLRVAALLGLAVLATVPLQAAATHPNALLAIEAIRWLAIAVVGYPIALRGVRSLVHARRITIELLMATAVVGAVAIGAAGEAVTVVLLFTLGEALEGYAAARSRDSLRSLLHLRPAEATVIRDHETPQGERHRHFASLPVASLVPGDRVLVRPGERLPADGRIVEGTSAVDEAAITGESVPVHRTPGDEVHAGTINGQGTLEVEVERHAEDFTISQIARLVEQAQAQRSPAERFVDRFAAWYTPAVVALAVVVAAGPPIFFGQPFLGVDDGAPGWLYRGLALLIIACPCALVISIPVTVVSALTRLAGLGVLVKGGAQLDELARTRVFAFDKTGTLTHGRPVVAGTRSSSCEHEEPSVAGSCDPCDEMVAMAAAVERGSEHPFAHAILSAANERRLEHRYAPATGITAHAGRGVSGNLGGRRVTVGHQALFSASAELDRMLGHEEDSERSVMVVGTDDRLLGVIHVEDRLRDSTRAALESLRAVDPAYRFVMLTGDRRRVAEALGRKLGHIDELRCELLPAEKLAAVRALEAEHGPAAMVGDGINDAPALAAARLGIAMGGAGSHQAMEVADIVLMQDDLSHLPLAVRISRKTQALVRQNIALSLGLKLAFLALAVPGLATLWMAVVADVGATVLVTLNGMRMLRAS